MKQDGPLRRLAALAWEAVLLELALYRSLARWVARRPDVPQGATPIGYAQLAAPMTAERIGLWVDDPRAVAGFLTSRVRG